MNCNWVVVDPTCRQFDYNNNKNNKKKNEPKKPSDTNSINRTELMNGCDTISNRLSLGIQIYGWKVFLYEML